jgi:hypothetical protein
MSTLTRTEPVGSRSAGRIVTVPLAMVLPLFQPDARLGAEHCSLGPEQLSRM